MRSTPTDAALIAAEQVTRMPRWADFDAMFEAEIRATQDQMLAETNPVILHQLQGRALALKEFQHAVRDASRTLAKKGLRAPL